MRFLERFSLAVNVLRGRVTIKDGVAVCAREHVEAGEVRVKRADYDALRNGNVELGVLRGAVATLETAKYEQVRKITGETLQHFQK